MDATLSVRSDDFDTEGLQKLTDDLCRDLNRETDVSASLAEHSGEFGDKGDLITVGTIILTLLGSRGVGRALVDVLGAYINRGHHLEVEVKGKSGATVKITGENLSPDQLSQTVRLVNRVLEASE